MSNQSDVDSFSGTNAASQPNSDFKWIARVQRKGSQEAKVYTRNLSFSVKKQVGFAQEDVQPSAVEYLLGALGGDLVTGFEHRAAKAGISISNIEIVLSGILDNPLVVLDVIGSEGRPTIKSVKGTMYVRTDAEETILNKIWADTLARSPLVSTLERCVDLSLKIQSEL